MTLLVGDSLAVGLTPYVHARHVDAQAGRSSADGAAHALRYRDRRVFVSLGANDPPAAVPSFRRSVRSITAGRSCTAWLLVPSRPRLNAVLALEAERDVRLVLVGMDGVRLADGVHPGPAGYRLLARRLERACP